MTYSHDGFGLGHLRRTTNIASRLVQDVPGSSVLMLVGCSLGSFFELPTGVDCLKVPSIIKTGNGVYHPLSLHVTVDEMKALRASTIQEAVRVFKPKLLLVDHKPTGVWRELLPTLRMLRYRADQPIVVLGMRDIVDDPKVVRDLWTRENTYQDIADHYDEVVVYGCREVFDMASEYGLDAEMGDRIRYCGYVCSEEVYRSKEQMHEDLQLKKDKLILVTAGGGYDAYPMMEACMEALRFLGKNPPFEIVFVTGPLMRSEHQQCLRRQADRKGVRVLSHVREKLSYMNAADLVITMGGYNSLAEIVRLKKKALVIPRSGPRIEQIMRAELFAERGLVDVLLPSEAAPKVVAERIMTDLERSDYPAYDGTISLNGAKEAASRLAELARAKARSSQLTAKSVVSSGASA